MTRLPENIDDLVILIESISLPKLTHLWYKDIYNTYNDDLTMDMLKKNYFPFTRFNEGKSNIASPENDGHELWEIKCKQSNLFKNVIF